VQSPTAITTPATGAAAAGSSEQPRCWRDRFRRNPAGWTGCSRTHDRICHAFGVVRRRENDLEEEAMAPGAVIHVRPRSLRTSCACVRSSSSEWAEPARRECPRQAACPSSAGRALDGDAFGSDAKFSYPRVVAAGAGLERGDRAADSCLVTEVLQHEHVVREVGNAVFG
jgi:hypothetical protein